MAVRCELDRDCTQAATLRCERARPRNDSLLGLDGNERAAVYVEAVAIGDAAARLLSSSADDGESRPVVVRAALDRGLDALENDLGIAKGKR
jgi:hypothetical protein